MTTKLAERDVDVAGPVAEDVQYPYVLHGIDPRDLIREGNTRVVGDIRETRPDLVASIAEHGVDPKISIINVVRRAEDDALVVLVGFHRTAAAIAVKELENPDLTIVVLLHAPGTTRREVLVAQGIENIHRQGYTQAEEAGLYEQLSLAGLDDGEISRQLTRPVERVRAGRAVAGSPPTRAASEAVPALDLLSLSLLAEFADDEADHQRLVEVLATRPQSLDYEMKRIRGRREMEAAKSEEEKRLAELGYGIIENQFEPPEGAVRLEELCAGEDARPLAAAEHTDCPGRAVAVDVDSDLQIERIEFCGGFAEHGHRTIVSVKAATAMAQLEADGVPIAHPEADGLVRLRDLFADERAEHPIPVEQHTACPGHAAYIEQEPWEVSVDIIHVCTDPAAHGHVVRGARAAKPEQSAAVRKLEYDRTRVNNAAWRKRKAERRTWLDDFFAKWRSWNPEKAAQKGKQRSKAPVQVQMLPPRVHHLLTLAPVLAPHYLAEALPGHHYACRLLKLDQPSGRTGDTHPMALQLRKRTTSETQAHLVRLAQVVGACEQHWDYAHTDNADSSWRSPSRDARFYFELLEALGYPLEHVEKLFNNPELDHAKWPHLTPEPTTDPLVDCPDAPGNTFAA